MLTNTNKQFDLQFIRTRYSLACKFKVKVNVNVKVKNKKTNEPI